MATEASAFPSSNLRSAAASSTYASASTSTTGASTSSSSGSLDEADFLSLLTTQLQNQDPLSPMDDTQSAQFSQLQSQQSLTSQFQSFESNSAVQQAASMLGAAVTVATTDASGNSSSVSGTVNAIQVVNGQPQFTMTGSDGKVISGANGTPTEFTTSQITTIQQ